MLESMNVKKEKLEDISEFIVGVIGWKGLSTKHYTDDGVPMIRIVDIKNGQIDMSKVIKVLQEKYDEQPQIHLEAGEIVFSKAGTLGLAAKVHEGLGEICFNAALCRIKIKAEYNPDYILVVLLSKIGQMQALRNANGIAQPDLTLDEIRSFLIPIPDEETQNKVIESYFSGMKNYREKLKEAKESYQNMLKDIDKTITS